MIDSYDFSRITINGKHYTTDILVFPEKIKADWRRKKGHSLQIADLRRLLRQNQRCWWWAQATRE
jgi:hypothetical protein